MRKEFSPFQTDVLPHAPISSTAHRRRPGRATTRPSEKGAEISQLIAILHKWGVHTLGELAALKRDQLAARLGAEAVRLWEEANGKSTRLLRLVRPTEIFAELMEFEHEIETAEPLLFVLRRFLEQLTLRLGALYLVAREITLRLIFADKSRYEHAAALLRVTLESRLE